MPTEKVFSLAEAVSRFVPSGATVVMGTGLEAMIPFAAGREIIRQRLRDLTLVGPISDILFDQLVGGGCVRKIQAAWAGNVATGSGYNIRRWVESGRIEFEDHSNFTLALALQAGAMGIPFLPTRSALGSDLFLTNNGLKRMRCPLSGESLVAVAAIVPDVAIVHVQRADSNGSAHLWGNLGVTRSACLASRKVVLTCEEIVDRVRIRKDPNRILIPAFRVSAVVRLPWGAHPSPVPGYYNRDHQAYIDYRRQSRSESDFAQWKARWIDRIGDQQQYRACLGDTRRKALAIRNAMVSEGVDYGF